MKRKIIALLILLTMLIGAVPVTAANTSGFNFIPVNYDIYVYRNSYGTMSFELGIHNICRKTITEIGVVWYPRNSWGTPLMYGEYNYFTTSRDGLYIEGGDYEYVEWTTSASEYKNASQNYTSAAIASVKFSDGTEWANNGVYGTAEFIITNPRLDDGRYLVDAQYPYVETLRAGSGVYKDAWYVWNDGQGWVWYDSGEYSYCGRWGNGGSIKHVINDDPGRYHIMNFQIARTPLIYANFYGSGDDTYKVSTSDSLYIDMPSNAKFPFCIGLWDGGNDPYVKSRCWYIKLEGSDSYVPFSYEKGPMCQVWKEGTHSIKLVYNNDYKYCSEMEFTIKR